MLSENTIVGVVAEHDLSDIALVGLVRGCGYQAVLVDYEQPLPAVTAPLGAVILRAGARLHQVAGDQRCARASVALIETAAFSHRVRSGVTLIPATDQAGVHLERFLEDKVGVPRRPAAVALSRRECEVLTTYVLGATVEETAAEHFVATSTVRTHYRRVTARYSCAGRSVTNKSQLLLQMVADGWIQLPDGGPGSAAGEDPDLD